MRFVAWLGAGILALGSELPVRVYSTSDGLSNSSVNRIVSDSHGFLWFGTSDGVSRFDGYGFLNFGVADGLSHRRVNDVLETRGGDFWIATGGGVCRLGGKGPPAVERSLAPAETRWITRLLEPRASTPANPLIWCGTDSGLYRFTPRDGKFEQVELGKSASEQRAFVMDLFEDSRGVTWAGTSSGLYRWKDGSELVRYTVAQGLPANEVTSIRQDAAGAIWVATWKGAARIADGGADRVLTRKNGLAGDYLYSVLPLANGELWLAGTGGISVVGASGAVQRTMNAKAGLIVDDVEALGLDASGNVWAGTDGGGAAKIAQSGFTTFGQEDGITGRPADIFESKAGELVLVTKADDAMRVYVRNAERFRMARLIPQRSRVGWGIGQVFAQGAGGIWWAATGGGLLRFPSSKAAATLGNPVAVDTSGMGAAGPIKAFEDSKGTVWLAFRMLGRGLARKTASGPVERIAAPSSSFPFVFAEDSAGTLWIGYFQGGLARYRGGQVEEVRLPERGASGVRSLLIDGKKRLWVGTSEAGLLRCDDPGAEQPAFVSYATPQGFSGSLIECLTEDRAGQIYACTGRGVDALDPVSGRLRHYTTADGLVRGDVQLAFRDREGALWFGGSRGISRLIPQPGIHAAAPYVQISRMDVGGVAQGISPVGQRQVSGLRLPFGSGPIRVEVTGVTFRPGDMLRYQTKLEGADRDWSTPSADRAFSYGALQPGAYRFQARAVNADGLESGAAEAEFTILAPFWQRAWFLGLLALMAGSLAVIAHRTRVARLLEIERVRNRIAADLHDDIGSSLSQISVLSAVARSESAAGAHAPIDKIAELSRQMLESMSDIVWAINPARDQPADLIQRMRHFAAELFTAADIELEFRVEPAGSERKLKPELRRELLLAFKEAANNVVKHSGAKRVRVTVGGDRGRFRFEVTDDGRGFDRTAHSAEGNGLASIERRLQALRGSAQIVSSPGAGTTVRIEAPV